MKKILCAVFTSAVFAVPLMASADTFTHGLTVGSRGDEVLSLQKALVTLNYLKTPPTGYFGVLTKQALMAYQKANGLEAVGSVGPKTRAMLNAYLAAQITPQPAPSPTPAAPTPVIPAPAPPAPASPSPATSSSVSSPNDPPLVTLISPSSMIPRAATQATFSVATDKPANCRYGTQPGIALTYMKSFTYTGGTTHTSTLNISPDALYVYYVRCEGVNAQLSTETTVSFSATGQ